ncbi:zinc finger, CCHC-type containing protein [Tanacetum coccineum]|uniref:Zinc finger, CCHC-type containing protein n=1 Tax=Tanacetum coccineum TaxID=301880 RepID=A0ABQ5I282_9ASTR
MDVHSTDSGSKIQTNTLRIFYNVWIHLTSMVNIEKGHDYEDLTTHFLAQFFPSGRATKLRNDILMFQQHHGESLSEAWTHFKDLLQKVSHHGIDPWLQVEIFYDHVNQTTRRAINHSASGKLRDKSVEEYWEIIEDLALYDNES